MQPDFRTVAQSVGCILNSIREDDRIHRCPTKEHPKKRNGAYRTDGRRGWAKNWETGETAIWHADEKPREGKRTAPPVPMPSLVERRAQEDRAARQAAERAREMVRAATMTTHPYLERKGFPKAIGLVLGDLLLVPAYVGRELVSLQQIDSEGGKKNLPGGRMSGACFSFGGGPVEILCEGYATGLSIKAALAAMHQPGRVTCCFSASNVAEVATNRRRALIFADHDKPLPQFGGVGAGEFYARRAAVPYAMPPDIGTDANDLHGRDAFALQALLLDLIGRRRQHIAA